MEGWGGEEELVDERVFCECLLTFSPVCVPACLSDQSPDCVLVQSKVDDFDWEHGGPGEQPWIPAGTQPGTTGGDRNTEIKPAQRECVCVCVRGQAVCQMLTEVNPLTNENAALLNHKANHVRDTQKGGDYCPLHLIYGRRAEEKRREEKRGRIGVSFSVWTSCRLTHCSQSETRLTHTHT